MEQRPGPAVNTTTTGLQNSIEYDFLSFQFLLAFF